MVISENVRLYKRFRDEINEASTLDELAAIQADIDAQRSAMAPATAQYLDEQIEIKGSLSVYTAMYKTGLLAPADDEAQETGEGTDSEAPEASVDESSVDMDALFGSDDEPPAQVHGVAVFSAAGVDMPLSQSLNPDEIRDAVEKASAKEIERLESRLSAPPPENIALSSLLVRPEFIAAAREYEAACAQAQAEVEANSTPLSELRLLLLTSESEEEMATASSRYFMNAVQNLLSSADELGASDLEDLENDQASPFDPRLFELSSDQAQEFAQVYGLMQERLQIVASSRANTQAVLQRRDARAAGLNEQDLYALAVSETAEKVPSRIRAFAETLKEQAEEIHEALQHPSQERMQRLNERIQDHYNNALEAERLFNQFASLTSPPKPPRR